MADSKNDAAKPSTPAAKPTLASNNTAPKGEGKPASASLFAPRQAEEAKSEPAKTTTSKNSTAKKPAAKSKAKSSAGKPSYGANSKKSGLTTHRKVGTKAKKPQSKLPGAQNAAARTGRATAQAAITNATEQTRKASESTRQTTHKVVKMHASNFRDLFSQGARDTQSAQSQLFASAREGAARFAKRSEQTAEHLNTAISQGRGTVEACIECGNITADMTKNLTNEMFRFANESFSESVEISKDAFSCRTINDVFDLQNKLVRNHVDNLFEESVRLSEMFFQYANVASQPLNEHFNKCGTQMQQNLQKSFAA